MSQQSRRLFEAMSDLPDKMIDQAGETARQKKPGRWKKWAALAACLAIVVGLGTWLLPRMGGSAGGEGSDGATTFMSYAGPVFPLTLKEENSALTAQRSLTLDFTPWIPEWWSNEEEAASRNWVTEEERQEVLEQYNEWFPEGGYYRSSTDILVTDAYTLANTTGEDQTVTVLYPFAAPLQEVVQKQPTLTVDGTAVEAQLVIGAYSGSFMGAIGAQEEGGSVNLDYADNWEDYQALLSDGSYLSNALGEAPDVSGISVIVYEFVDAYGPEKSDEMPNPSIRVNMELDYDKTTVLSWNFGAGGYDGEAGTMIRGFSIPQPGERDYGESRYLLVIGEDVENMTTAGYVTGGVDEDTPTLEGCGVTIKRYESDLDTMLRHILSQGWSTGVYEVPSAELGFETCYRAFLEHFLRYGVLSDSDIERYVFGNIEDYSSETMYIDRVCWLECEVTIPAGGSVAVEASFVKQASFDYACAHTKNRGIYGYDLVTQLGSNLNCTSQTATLEDRGQIEIVRQNFGFDLAAGVKTVSLDVAQEHYYLEVRRIDS